MPIYSNRPGGPAGGDLSGSYPDPQVINLSGSATGSFTGSFYGNGSSLTDLPSASIDHVIFVTKGGNDSTGNGSITKPFLTVQAAIDYASSSYPNFNEGVQIEIAPGLYTENVTLPRHNTYIVSSLKIAEQRSVAIKGNFTINCTAAAQKFNHIVGLEGIFFDNSEDSTSPTLLLTGSATSGHLTYLKGCYVAQNSSGSNANAFKTSGLRFSNNFSGSKITAQNTTFLAQKAGADVVSLNGGDYRFDSCEVYCNVTGSSTTGSGIRIVGETALLMDRAIVEIYTNGYAVSNASTKTTDTICFISNTSLSSTGTGSVGIVSSSTNIILWNDIFTGYNVAYPNYKINGTVGRLAYFSHLTAPVPMTSTGITLVPLTETHGTIVAASVTSSLGFSGSLSSSYLVGTIPVSKGGTGAATFTSASLLVGNTTGAFGTISPTSISGSLLVSNGTTWTSINTGSLTASYALDSAGGLSGGTTNYIPMWTGTNTLGTSSLYVSDASNIASKVQQITINGRPAFPALVGSYNGGDVIIKGGNGDRLLITGPSTYNYYSGGDVIISGGVNQYNGAFHGDVKIISSNELHLTGSTIHLSGTIQNNIKLSDSAGIVFGTTYGEIGGGAGASKTLDDYEEGTWSPAFIYLGTSTGTLATTVLGYYVKVGKKVTCTGYIDCTDGTFNITDGGGNFLQINGLPFTSKTTSNASAGALIVTQQSGWFGTQNIPVYGPIESNSAKVNRLHSAGSESQYMNGNSWTTSLKIRFILEYISA